MSKLLSLRLSVHYGDKAILRDVALEVGERESLGVIGQSGSGKSTLALAILGLLGWQGGRMTGSLVYNGREMTAAKDRDWRKLRGKEIGLVLQSASSALNPALRLETQFREAWQAHSHIPWRERRQEALALLARFDLPTDDSFLARFPRQISIGQAQRVLIAMAILHKPPLLVTDEPTSALDPITGAEILNLFADLNRRLNVAILYISHDLLSVARICHRIAILHDGEVVECDASERIFNSPAHPFTRQLIAALPTLPSAQADKQQRTSFESMVLQ